MNRFLYSCLALASGTIAVGAWLIPPTALGPTPSGVMRSSSAEVPAASTAPGRLEDFAAMAERPPFSASRRAAASATDDSATLVLGRYRLSGVVVAPTNRAVILSGSDNRSLVVSEGETLDGWTVDEITPKKVVFTSDGRRQVFQVEQPDG